MNQTRIVLEFPYLLQAVAALTGLTLLLVAAKMTVVPALSWWWALSPAYVPAFFTGMFVWGVGWGLILKLMVSRARS